MMFWRADIGKAAGQLHTDQEIGLGWVCGHTGGEGGAFASCEQKLVALEMAQVCTLRCGGTLGSVAS